MRTDDALNLERWVHQRDADAFRELVERYASMVFAASKRVLGNVTDAEDAAQECFQTLATTVKPPAAYLGPWLHRVATNIALNKRRGESRLRAREHAFAEARPASADPSWNDVYQYVDEALTELPESLRMPLIAHYLEGRCQADIADAMGIPRQTLNHRIHKGVEELRLSLARRGVTVGGAALGVMLASNLSDAAAAPASLIATLGKAALSGARGIAVTPRTAWWASAGLVKAITVSVLALSVAGLAILASRSTTETQRAAITVGGTGVAPGDFAPGATTSASETDRAPRNQTSTAASSAAFHAAPPQTPDQVLDAYAAHQQRIAHITFRYESTIKWDRHFAPGSEWAFATGRGAMYESGELSSDGTRSFFHSYTWGDYAGRYIPPGDPNERICIYDGKKDIQWQNGGSMNVFGSGSIGDGAPIGETIQQPRSNGLYYGFWGMHAGPHAFGFFTEEGRRIDVLLREATRKTLRTVREDDADYLVVDAETAYGSFSVWFNPAVDFNIARVLLTQREGHRQWKGEKSPLPRGYVRSVAYNVVEFANVNGLWVTASYVFETEGSNPESDYYATGSTSYERTAIVLNEDFDKLGSFAFMREVPAGSEWFHRTFPGDTLTDDKWFVWNGSALEPRPPRRR